ncbi:hypothetical protein ACFLXE_05460, partial [Chloroflexota bacterium]
EKPDIIALFTEDLANHGEIDNTILYFLNNVEAVQALLLRMYNWTDKRVREALKNESDLQTKGKSG